MSVFFRKPPYSTHAAPPNLTGMKCGDLVDMGSHVFKFFNGNNPTSVFCSEDMKIVGADANLVMKVVDAEAFVELVNAGDVVDYSPNILIPAMYAITDIVSQKPIPSRQSTAPGFQYDAVSGQFWQGGPVILLSPAKQIPWYKRVVKAIFGK